MRPDFSDGSDFSINFHFFVFFCFLFFFPPFPRLPTKAMIGYVGAAWGGSSGGCKAGLTLKEEDSFLLPPRPWPWCGGGVGSARCSLGTHPPCESNKYMSALQTQAC